MALTEVLCEADEAKVGEPEFGEVVCAPADGKTKLLSCRVSASCHECWLESRTPEASSATSGTPSVRQKFRVSSEYEEWHLGQIFMANILARKGFYALSGCKVHKEIL